jgi:hypothetical protein
MVGKDPHHTLSDLMQKLVSELHMPSSEEKTSREN